MDRVVEFVRDAIEAAALGVEVLAVLVIVIAIVSGTGRFLVHTHQGRNGYRAYKEHLTKSLLLGLEFLVAADIVRTVAIDATLTNVAILGALVIIRTVLSWSLVVEMDGRWPWQVGAAETAMAAPVREDT